MPACSRPCPVPRVHEEKFRKEIDRLVLLGVLEETNYSEWGSPSFAQPKPKTDRIIFLSDFRNLNRRLKFNHYPMSTIRQILLNVEGFQYTTSFDLNMDDYNIRMSKEASNLCTIILTFGKYKYECLPMGGVAPRIFSKRK